jgi:hypothetical protein
VRLCQIENRHKIEKKKRGMVVTVGDDVWGCCFQGPVSISKYGK